MIILCEGKNEVILLKELLKEDIFNKKGYVDFEKITKKGGETKVIREYLSFNYDNYLCKNENGIKNLLRSLNEILDYNLHKEIPIIVFMDSDCRLNKEEGRYKELKEKILKNYDFEEKTYYNKIKHIKMKNVDIWIFFENLERIIEKDTGKDLHKLKEDHEKLKVINDFLEKNQELTKIIINMSFFKINN